MVILYHLDLNLLIAMCNEHGFTEDNDWEEDWGGPPPPLIFLMFYLASYPISLPWSALNGK